MIVYNIRMRHSILLPRCELADGDDQGAVYAVMMSCQLKRKLTYQI